MTSNKPVITGPTIYKEIERYSKMTVQEYTTTIFNSKGKLLDDGIDVNTDKLYWESFIDPKQAAELERRLALIESEDYQQEDFKEMEGKSVEP